MDIRIQRKESELGLSKNSSHVDHWKKHGVWRTKSRNQRMSHAGSANRAAPHAQALRGWPWVQVPPDPPYYKTFRGCAKREPSVFGSSITIGRFSNHPMVLGGTSRAMLFPKRMSRASSGVNSMPCNGWRISLRGMTFVHVTFSGVIAFSMDHSPTLVRCN